MDFTDKNPRKFRLGVIGDIDVWNPERKNSAEEFERRVATVDRPPFEGGKWTHILITYVGINTDRSISKLFIDGQFQGEIKGINDPFTWEEENAKIMLGLGYIGKIDDITVFDKALNNDEIEIIYNLKGGVKELYR